MALWPAERRAICRTILPFHLDSVAPSFPSAVRQGGEMKVCHLQMSQATSAGLITTFGPPADAFS